MQTEELLQIIKEKKKETDTLILAHSYQEPEVIEAADIVGDSYALSVAATKNPAKRVILCGVRFMAETVKILSPEKTVILPKPRATCPMAEQISPERVRKFREENPGVAVVAYINTTAELKAEADVCVTSSSAVKIVSALPQKDILFIPDQNLGAWVQKQCPDKHLILWDGYCPIHSQINEQDVLRARAQHPGAKLAMHPECGQAPLAYADCVGSTSAIINYALNTDDDVIIGTERGVADFLQRKYPERNFFQLRGDKLVCKDMKMTSLADVYNALTGGGEEIQMEEALRVSAKRSIDNMLKYGG